MGFPPIMALGQSSRIGDGFSTKKFLVGSKLLEVFDFSCKVPFHGMLGRSGSKYSLNKDVWIV
jgi:hypothetical protein